MPNRPCLELGAGLLLLLGQELTTAFELPKLGLDRCGFPLAFVALLLAAQTIRLERRLRLACGPLHVDGGLQGAAGSLQFHSGALARAGEFVDDAASGLLGRVEPLELALERLERLDGRRVTLLGDAGLMLALGQAEPHIGDGFLVAPASLPRGEQRRTVLRVAWFELGDRLRGRGALDRKSVV